MRLYEVPDETKIRVLGKIDTPAASPDINVGDELFFRNIDGMFSYCERGNEIVHLVAWAEVEIL